MKLAIEIGPATGDLARLTQWVQHAERLGVSMAFSAEAWWSDAATVLAYLAAQTERIRLATGIMQITARVPAMTAMTAQATPRWQPGLASPVETCDLTRAPPACPRGLSRSGGTNPEPGHGWKTLLSSTRY